MNSASPVLEMPSEEFARAVYKTIAHEYGVAGLMRFLREHGRRSGDYTEDRKLWTDAMTLDQLMDEVEIVTRRLKAEQEAREALGGERPQQEP